MTRAEIDATIDRVWRAARERAPGAVVVTAGDALTLLLEIERLREVERVLRLIERSEARVAEDTRAG